MSILFENEKKDKNLKNKYFKCYEMLLKKGKLEILLKLYMK